MKDNNQTSDKMIDRMLGESGLRAPEGMADRIMHGLPDSVPAYTFAERIIQFWPQNQWIMPATAGAVAAILMMCAIFVTLSSALTDRVLVTFAIEAPDAKQIELVGSFSNWEPGQIKLEDPDGDGRWSASVKLEEGRHEYMFLVDGEAWITDPSATIHRPDGFGRKNAIIEI